jgi:hypothetical protein
MPAGINDQTQRICESEPFCLCAGEPQAGDEEKHAMECCCVQRCGGPTCDNCDAALVLIDLESGERVLPLL